MRYSDLQRVAQQTCLGASRLRTSDKTSEQAAFAATRHPTCRAAAALRDPDCWQEGRCGLDDSGRLLRISIGGIELVQLIHFYAPGATSASGSTGS